MPANMQTLDQKKYIPRPDMDARVLVKVNKKQEQEMNLLTYKKVHNIY